uniref:Uncharacterized protein n=1 Tax=Oryza meridionalis TaxID=40149 RepID=A0A0E0F9A3_9ORYZ
MLLPAARLPSRRRRDGGGREAYISATALLHLARSAAFPEPAGRRGGASLLVSPRARGDADLDTAVVAASLPCSCGREQEHAPVGRIGKYPNGRLHRIVRALHRRRHGLGLLKISSMDLGI